VDAPQWDNSGGATSRSRTTSKVKMVPPMPKKPIAAPFARTAPALTRAALVLLARATPTLVALAGAALATFALVAVARAGEYHVYSCRTPSGQVAPTVGWSRLGTGGYDYVVNTCEKEGGLVAALLAGVTHPIFTDVATWAFNAPAGETIAGATLWRAGDTAGGVSGSDSYIFSLTTMVASSQSAPAFDKCVAEEKCSSEGSLASPFAANNRVVAPQSASGSTTLSLTAYCGSPFKETQCPNDEGDQNGYAAVIELFAADLVLDQPEGPSVSSVEGGLVASATVGGTSDVAFDASDRGSGVYEAVFRVDGEVVNSTVLDEEGGRCRDVGQTTDGPPAFLYPQPCPASLSVDVPFDTTGLSNGTHHLVASVTDAAGNAATVLDREIVVDNPSRPGSAPRGPANGVNASEHAVLTARWRSAAQGHRRGAAKGRARKSKRAHPGGLTGAHLSGNYGAARTVEGRLTGPEGRAIAGAQIEAEVVPAYTGARAYALAAVRTAADGSWSLDLPRDTPSCALRVAYRSHLGDTVPAATRTLTLTVHAAVVLHIAPRVIGAQGTIFFSGRLLGGPIPPGGKQLVLEASSPGGRWIEFHVIRTDGRGRFRSSYRFRLPGPALYRFRVLSEYEADFPFAAGASSVVRVFEG
jgi:hypothetical protein